jgi:hypothetical protein
MCHRKSVIVAVPVAGRVCWDNKAVGYCPAFKLVGASVLVGRVTSNLRPYSPIHRASLGCGASCWPPRWYTDLRICIQTWGFTLGAISHLNTRPGTHVSTKRPATGVSPRHKAGVAGAPSAFKRASGRGGWQLKTGLLAECGNNHAITSSACDTLFLAGKRQHARK